VAPYGSTGRGAGVCRADTLSPPPHRSSPRYLAKLDVARQKLVIYPLRHNFTTQLLRAGVLERARIEHVGRAAGTDAHAGSLKARSVEKLAVDARAVWDGYLQAVWVNLQSESSDRLWVGTLRGLVDRLVAGGTWQPK